MKIECLIRPTGKIQQDHFSQLGFTVVKSGRRKAFAVTLEQALDLTLRQKLTAELEHLDIQCMLEAETPAEERKMRKLGANSLEVGGKFGIFCDLCDVNSYLQFKTPVNKNMVARQSKVHGKGGFAKRDLKAGDRVIEYTGRRMTTDEATDNMPHDPKEPNHTFLFTLSGDKVIDAFYGGNAAMWINHSCAPNMYAEVGADDRVWLYAAKDIPKGVELSYDYQLQLEGRMTKAMREDYECRCGSANCRGTMLDVKPQKRNAA